MNLATRIMSNGAEVIVADRSSHQGENLRIAPTAVRVGTSLPSTISDEMFSKLPPDGPQVSHFKLFINFHVSDEKILLLMNMQIDKMVTRQ